MSCDSVSGSHFCSQDLFVSYLASEAYQLQGAYKRSTVSYDDACQYNAQSKAALDTFLFSQDNFEPQPSGISQWCVSIENTMCKHVMSSADIVPATVPFSSLRPATAGNVHDASALPLSVPK